MRTSNSPAADGSWILGLEAFVAKVLSAFTSLGRRCPRPFKAGAVSVQSRFPDLWRRFRDLEFIQGRSFHNRDPVSVIPRAFDVDLPIIAFAG